MGTMNNLQKNFIIAMCLIAFVCCIFAVKYARQKTETISLAERVENQESLAKMQQLKTQQLKDVAERARIKALNDLKKAEQARKMLEKTKAQSEKNQQKLLADLNAQLEREANARSSAESASIELARQKEALQKAVGEARQTIAKLQQSTSGKNNTDKLLDFYKNLIREKDAEIADLRQKQLELDQLKKNAEAAQISTEKEILSKGGTITLPKSRRLLSPNFRGM